FPPGGTDNRLDGSLRGAGDGHSVEPRPLARMDYEIERHLLRLGIAFNARHDVGFIETIPLQHALQALASLQHVAFGILGSELELGRGHELAMRWGFGYAFHQDVTDEVRRLGN